MNYRDVVNNIINDAKLLTKMTASQSSIFRRKIYSRINDATQSEEVHKEIPYPNKKRKIIDKDNNIGSLLIMYKGLMERYTTFTNKSKIILKRNHELDAALCTANNRLYFKTIEKIIYQWLLLSVLIMFIWMDVQTFSLYKSMYEKSKEKIIDNVYLVFMFIMANGVWPLIMCLGNFFTYIIDTLSDWVIIVFGC